VVRARETLVGAGTRERLCTVSTQSSAGTGRAREGVPEVALLTCGVERM
jgi:hypothetical protein